MNCRKCNMPLENTYICPHCGYEDKVVKKIIYSSNWHYNQGLAQVKVRDLSGAIGSLSQALKYNKRNTTARNLLGLVYYQTGEIVSALGEWVISVHFQPKNNPATAYIQDIQSSPEKLQEANKIIQKYNMAVTYVSENNADMAIIELKKVVNLNPNYVRAYQLLGLLYMQRKQYSAARKVLTRAVKVDRNNMTTLNYLQELNQMHSKKSGNGKSGENQLTISDPNPIVIQQNKGDGYNDYNTSFLSFVNVLIGVVIGAAVIWLLIVPSITKVKASEYNNAIVQYSAQISERNKEVSSLQSQVDDLTSQLDQYKATVGDTVNDAGTSETNLMSAISLYLQNDLYSAGMMAAEIEPAAITNADEKKSYTIICEATKDKVTDDLYETGYNAFESGSYVEAIDGFIKVLRMDASYTSAIFYMGRSYQALGDTTNAASYYQQLITSYPNSSYLNQATQYLSEVQGATTAQMGDQTESDTTESTESEDTQAAE